MKNIFLLLFIAAAFSPLQGQGQQTPPPQPAQPQGNFSPCASAPQPLQKFHFKIPPALQQVINKQRQQIEGKTGISVPDPQDLIKDAQQAKPCVPASAAPVVSPTVIAPAAQPVLAPAPAPTPQPQQPK